MMNLVHSACKLVDDDALNITVISKNFI